MSALFPLTQIKFSLEAVRRLQNELNQLAIKHKEREERLSSENSNLKEALRLCMADLEKEKSMTDTLQQCVKALKITNVPPVSATNKNQKDNEGGNRVGKKDENEEEKKSKKKRQTCRFFSKPQGCRKGEECNFSHDVRYPVGIKKRKSKCRFFQRPGGCRNGDQCRFSHEEQQPVKSKSRECDFYNREMGCRNGDTCRFDHVDKAPCSTPNCNV